MSDPSMDIVRTLGEAGGVTGLVGLVLFTLIKLIQKNGCTARLNNCNGQEACEVDCEQGAPKERHVPKQSSESTEKRDVVRSSD